MLVRAPVHVCGCKKAATKPNTACCTSSNKINAPDLGGIKNTLAAAKVQGVKAAGQLPRLAVAFHKLLETAAWHAQRTRNKGKNLATDAQPQTHAERNMQRETRTETQAQAHTYRHTDKAEAPM